MARLHLALFFLVAIFAVIVSAADKPPSTTTASAPTATTPTDGIGGDVAEGPADDNAIGTTDDDNTVTPDDIPDGNSGNEDVAVAGPIGNDSSYANYPPPQKTSGSGVTVAFGFISVVAATVGSLFFF